MRTGTHARTFCKLRLVYMRSVERMHTFVDGSHIRNGHTQADLFYQISREQNGRMKKSRRKLQRTHMHMLG